MRTVFALLALFLPITTNALAAGGLHGPKVVKFKAGSELSKAVNRAAPGPSARGRRGGRAPNAAPGLTCHPCPPTEGPGDPPGITISEEEKRK